MYKSRISGIFVGRQSVYSRINYYIFKTEDVDRFDDLQLASYQKTDNQKTTLRINKEGTVLNQGTKHDYSAFEDFRDNFDCLEDLIEGDCWK